MFTMTEFVGERKRGKTWNCLSATNLCIDNNRVMEFDICICTTV